MSGSRSCCPTFGFGVESVSTSQSGPPGARNTATGLTTGGRSSHGYTECSHADGRPTMSTVTICDYCGLPTDDRFCAKVAVSGVEPDDGTLGWKRLDSFYGHFCTAPRDGHEQSCLARVDEAIWLAMAAGPSLEQIQTISNHKLAYRRRQHRREGDTDG